MERVQTTGEVEEPSTSTEVRREVVIPETGEVGASHKTFESVSHTRDSQMAIVEESKPAT
jgi:hypothetical protein